MFCENCGKQIDDDAKFCEYCGVAIGEEMETVEKTTATVFVTKKSKKKPIIIAIVSAIILFIAVAVAYSAYKWFKEKQMSKEIDSHSIFNSDDESKPEDTTKPTEKITTQKVITTPIATTKTTTTKAKSNDKTYSITFEANELIEEAGLQLGGHVGVAVLSNLTCSNGNANIETETIYAYDSLVRVEVTGAKAGEVVLGGTITTYGLDMFEGETVSYPVDSGVFLISKAVGEVSEDKPYVNANIEASRLTRGDGYEYNLYVDGEFSYVEVSYNTNEAGGGSSSYTSGSSSPIFLTSGSSFTSVTAYVTPYSADGIAGDTVSCTGYADRTIQTGGMSHPVDNMKGQINCHGGTVAGFTTDYIVNGGAVGKVRNSLGDTWHVTAKNACDNYGVTWYELWDSDDGDYYRWVDSNYIDFY